MKNKCYVTPEKDALFSLGKVKTIRKGLSEEMTLQIFMAKFLLDLCFFPVLIQFYAI